MFNIKKRALSERIIKIFGWGLLILVTAIIIIGILATGIDYFRQEENKIAANESQSEIISEDKPASKENNFIQASHVEDLAYSTMNGLKISAVHYCKRITGSSMQPTFFSGNTVCFIDYNKAMKSSLKEGMMISFYYNEETTRTHRIKALYSDYLLVQGDNVLGKEKIEYKDIKGIVVAIILT